MLSRVAVAATAVTLVSPAAALANEHHAALGSSSSVPALVVLAAAAAALTAVLIVATVVLARRSLGMQRAFEKRLEEGKHQLRTAVGHMAQGLVMFDADRRVAIFNDRYIEMYDLSSEVVKPGLSFHELLQHRKDRGSFAGDVDAYCEGIYRALAGTSHTPVLTEPIPGRFIMVANRPVEGGGWVATHDDVTERQNLLRSRARAEMKLLERKLQLDAALNNMTHGLCMYDAQGRVVLFNKQFAAMRGYDPETLLGRSQLDLLRERFRAGDTSVEPEALFASCMATAAKGETTSRIIGSAQDRVLRVVQQPLPEGGWVSTFEDVTERQVLLECRERAEKKLLEQKIQLDAALNNMTHGLCMYDAEGRVVLFNRQYAVMRRHDPDTLLGRSLLDLMRDRFRTGDTSGEPEMLFASCVAAAARGESASRIIRSGDRLLRVADQPLAEGGWVSTFEDITERAQLEAERDRSRDFLQMIIDSVPSGIYVKRARDRRYLLVNRACEKFWDIPRDRMLGRTFSEFFPSDEAAFVSARDDELLTSGKPIFDEREIRTPTHGVRTVYARRIAIRDGNGEPEYILGVVDDITERRAADAKIAHLAHYDSLTGLPNRTLFCEQLSRRIDALPDGEKLALLYVDLDHFKSVNDTLGHATGDELLLAVADRMRAYLAEADLLARLSGDEFALVIAADDGAQALQDRVHRLREIVVGEPFNLTGHLAVIDLSIGIALVPDDGTDVPALLKHADLALYGAKLAGRATHRFFEPEMTARMKLRRDLEMDLRQAISRGELGVHYQPVVKLQNGEVTGCEALVRWQHAHRGHVAPAEFIPIAEETGLIAQIGASVLWQACRDAMRWPPSAKVAVNVSPVQLRNPDFPDLVTRCLKETGLAPDRLELEMTESVLMQSTDATLASLRRLQASGVRISLDDFGTGYSSLSYLRRFPFNRIKIDKSFVTDIALRPDALSIVRTILMLADSLGMTTTAEGVETEDQAALLKAIGCREMQGYLFSRPLPADAVHELMHGGVRKIDAA